MAVRSASILALCVLALLPALVPAKFNPALNAEVQKALKTVGNNPKYSIMANYLKDFGPASIYFNTDGMNNATLLIPTNNAVKKVTSQMPPNFRNSKKLMSIAQLNCITGKYTASDLSKIPAGTAIPTWTGSLYRLNGGNLAFALRAGAADANAAHVVSKDLYVGTLFNAQGVDKVLGYAG